MVEALRRHGRRPNPVYWVGLARLVRGAHVDVIAEEVMRSTGVVDVSGRSVRKCVEGVLAGDDRPRGRGAVLVMDNCEHVLDAVGPLIVGLLQAVPGLTVIATSREPVGWVDEHILTVRPLTVSNAVELFRRRAKIIGRPVSDDPEQLAVTEEICRHSDNNPLFIRLAAARLRHRPLGVVRRELSGDSDDRRMQWSHGAKMGVEERHGGVRDVIAWSYDLCSGAEQLLLDRMSVFAAGFEVHNDVTRSGGAEPDAIVAVCADECLPAEEIESLLERLVERSLVSVNIASATVRYFLLESVRVFVSGQLRLRGGGPSEAELLARLRRYYRDRVVSGRAIWSGPGQRDWLEWARGAWDNILLGIESGLTTPAEAVIGVETASAFISLRAPFVISHAGRAMPALIERAVEAAGGIEVIPTRLRVAALADVGHFALWHGQYDYAAKLLDECVAACVPDSRLARGWRDTPGSDIGLPAELEFFWGVELMLRGSDPHAPSVLARARKKFAEAGDLAGQRRSDMFESLACSLTGDGQHALEVARRHLDRVLESESENADWVNPWARLAWMLALLLHGDPHEALKVGRTVLKRYRAGIDPWTTSWIFRFGVAALARVLADRIAREDAHRDDWETAAAEIALLHGAVAESCRSMGITVENIATVAAQTKRVTELVTSIIGADGFAAAMELGAQLSVESPDLHALMLGTRSADDLLHATTTDRRAATSRWQDLSPAEREIAVLVAAGWANSAIAARRGSSIRTVDTQVSIILRKLTLTTRYDIITLVPQELIKRIQLEARERPTRLRHLQH
ncbi:LuxR C-terminal-related transcriptional regulator [Nocardia sp. NPDC051900]|uniref:helix-turn-helix transcriptional regulator n=1 Tax=Nocardia sp. NPDC051900 TaxID=3364326 RepID=UPI00378CC2D4